MKKWLQDSVTLQKGDLVAVSDIKPDYQQLAIVEKVSSDTNGHNRYFTISYVSNGKRKLIDSLFEWRSSPAQSKTAPKLRKVYSLV